MDKRGFGLSSLVLKKNPPLGRAYLFSLHFLEIEEVLTELDI
jgi:hypothetical protein